MSSQQVIFYIFSAILLFSGIMVITSRHPVRGILFLVLCFFASSALWMMVQAEFLALVLIFVYVGAVMTLFLFVVMMLNIDLAPLRQSFVRYLPLGVLVMTLLVALMLMVIGPKYFGLSHYQMTLNPANYSNVKQLGRVLYTYYTYPFELAAMLLLVAIIAAISLAFRGRHGSKAQRISEQVAVRPQDRVRLVK